MSFWYPLAIKHGQWEFQDPKMEVVPYKAIFCGDIPVLRPYIGLIYGRYLQSIGSWDGQWHGSGKSAIAFHVMLGTQSHLWFSIARFHLFSFPDGNYPKVLNWCQTCLTFHMCNGQNMSYGPTKQDGNPLIFMIWGRHIDFEKSITYHHIPIYCHKSLMCPWYSSTSHCTWVLESQHVF